MLLMLGSNLVATLPELTNGTPVTITAATEPDLTDVQEALGSGPMLVRNGRRPELTARLSDTLQPRSAMGWNREHLFLAVADGRQPGLSVGVRLAAMADFMVELGCEEALNLDGGQSSALWLNGAIINHPSHGARNTDTINPVRGLERDVANAIVILRLPED
jgi:exopolysaccharide biosynthesis protein